MSTRKILVSIVGIILILGASGAVFQAIVGSREDPPILQVATPPKQVKGLMVKNEDLSSEIEITGRLSAPQQIDVFSEVGGTLKSQSSRFKEGNYFSKGAPLIVIDDTEQRLSLLAQKSSLMNQITLLLPDLKVDYPQSFPQWEAYLNEMDLEAKLAALPEPVDQKERYFISARNLYNLYYTIKSQEERLKKYTIRAPFSGRVSESLITAGTLVRVGQKLGSFFNSNNYELEAAVNLEDLEFIKVGNKVTLETDGEKPLTYQGTIRRISDVVDANTQTVKVFIAVSGKGLKEGMYLSGEIKGQPLNAVVALPRKLVNESNQIYIIQDSVLKLHPVQTVQTTAEQVYVQGIPDNTQILNEVVIGAYEGLKVNVY
ncbi:MAG: efflux RND transporter periplasmic adaptor subunit [Bacteroidota bacterium]